MKTQLKVCGMRDLANIQDLLEVGIDYIGFIFYPKSSRYVSDEQLIKIAQLTNNQPNTKTVGVFVDATIETIQKIHTNLPLDIIQLHGQEQPDFCASLQEEGFLVIKAFSIDNGFDFSQLEAYQNSCDYFLFDTKGKLPGGNGQVFNWAILKQYEGETPFFLSGGISLESVEALSKFEHPKLITLDINSGFELKPAFKNIEQIKTFKHHLQKIISK